MRTADLVRLYPRLFHMAAPSSWEAIDQHGLLSTEALLDLFEVPEPRRTELIEKRRSKTEVLEHPVHGTAEVRDQIPLSEAKLKQALGGTMSVEQWLRLLNARVFFWLQPERLQRMLTARAYRNRGHLVLTVNTDALLSHVGLEVVSLSRINSGSTAYKAAPRGPDTFVPIGEYLHPSRRRATRSASDVAELCVQGCVPEIRNVLIEAELIAPHGERTVIWSADGDGQKGSGS